MTLLNTVCLLLILAGLATIWLRLLEFVLNCYDHWKGER